MVLSGGVYGGKGVCLQCRSEIASGSNFRPTAAIPEPNTLALNLNLNPINPKPLFKSLSPKP